MRAVLILLSFALAACDDGNVISNEFRNGWAEADIEECNQGDWSENGWSKTEQDGICRCASKRAMKITSTRELLTEEGARKFQASVERCAYDFDKQSPPNRADSGPKG